MQGMASARVTIRGAEKADRRALVRLAAALWPDASPRDLGRHIGAVIAKRAASTLPLTFFVAEADARAIGFVEVGLRSHADGCDERRPVGFVEGWFVAPEQRRRGVGAALMAAAEGWARS